MNNPPASSSLLPGLGLELYRQVSVHDSLTPAHEVGEGTCVHPKSPFRHRSSRGENLEGDPIIFSTGEGLEA